MFDPGEAECATIGAISANAPASADPRKRILGLL
jgi:hypothetical protein